MSPLPGSHRPTLRAAVSVGLLSAWLVLLMAGFAWGGAVHLLLVASLATFPWKALRLPVEEPEASAPAAREPAAEPDPSNDPRETPP